ncbi:hypothetical protein ACSA002_3050 [Salmonella phage vB_SalM_SA002]|nr:hypothetical protein ACSA002_3050 [Salmonella phage vB_SalM_SA002]
MSSLLLQTLLGEGLESFEDSDGPAVVATPENTPAPTPSIDVTICEEEIAVVEAAEEAARAEVVLVDSAEDLAKTDALADAQTVLVTETSKVVASMESFIGSPMSKQDAMALQSRVIEATKGQYSQQHIVGSLEAFGTDITTDDALNAGLEGLGDFLKEARNKLSGIVQVLRAKVGGFFKDIGVNFDKVAKRSEAIQRLAKNTSGESNSSAIQLPLDTAWHLVKDGKVVTNLAKEVTDLTKLAESVMRDNNAEMSADRKKFIELVSPLATANLDEAQKIAKKISEWKLPKPSFAKTKIQTSARTVDLYRSDVLPGDEALFVTMPQDISVASDNVSKRLENISTTFFALDVSLCDVAKRPNKLDVAVDTLKPAEIVKITEAVSAILGDIKTYSKTWGAWDEANNELDRLMNILVNVEWNDDETYEGSTAYANGYTVYTSKLNYRVADAVWYINASYGYLSTYPVIHLSKKLIILMNRILEVCERSLATYSDNNLK